MVYIDHLRHNSIITLISGTYKGTVLEVQGGLIFKGKKHNKVQEPFKYVQILVCFTEVGIKKTNNKKKRYTPTIAYT